MIKICNGNGKIVIILKDKFAVIVRDTRGNCIMRIASGIELKFSTRYRIAHLVNLDDGALRDGDQVVTELHVGVCIATLQHEKVQRVIGIIGEGVRARI